MVAGQCGTTFPHCPAAVSAGNTVFSDFDIQMNGCISTQKMS